MWFAAPWLPPACCGPDCDWPNRLRVTLSPIPASDVSDVKGATDPTGDVSFRNMKSWLIHHKLLPNRMGLSITVNWYLDPIHELHLSIHYRPLLYLSSFDHYHWGHHAISIRRVHLFCDWECQDRYPGAGVNNNLEWFSIKHDQNL